MYAVITSGGKQYKVSAGDVLSIEKLEPEVGSAVEFSQVLMIMDGTEAKVGTPYLADAKVTAEVVEQTRGEKIKIIKFRRRKHHMKHQGHRQYLTVVKITNIEG